MNVPDEVLRAGFQAASPGQFLTLLSLEPVTLRPADAEAVPGTWSRGAQGQPAAVLFRGRPGAVGAPVSSEGFSPAARPRASAFTSPARPSPSPASKQPPCPADCSRPDPGPPGGEGELQQGSGGTVLPAVTDGETCQPVHHHDDAQVQAAALDAMSAAPTCPPRSSPCRPPPGRSWPWRADVPGGSSRPTLPSTPA